MSETALALPASAPPPKPPRRVKRDKYVRTITLYEKNLDSPTGRRETRIPATVDAAKVLAIMTAEKMRNRIEQWLNDVEDGKARPTPKEYKDMVEALKGCDDIIKGAMEVPSANKPAGAQSLILNNSVISTGAAGPSPASDLMSIVTSAAKSANQPKIVTETKNEPPS